MNIATPIPDVPAAGYPDGFWRSLVHLNHFRLFLACALGLTGLLSGQPFTRLDHPVLFTLICAAYFLGALLFRRPLLSRGEAFERQVVRQVIADLACLGVLDNASSSPPHQAQTQQPQGQQGQRLRLGYVVHGRDIAVANRPGIPSSKPNSLVLEAVSGAEVPCMQGSHESSSPNSGSRGSLYVGPVFESLRVLYKTDVLFQPRPTGAIAKDTPVVAFSIVRVVTRRSSPHWFAAARSASIPYFQWSFDAG